MQTLNAICFIAIGLKIVMKLIFWLMIKERRKRTFFRSFFRMYSVYDMHDAPNPETVTFSKVSNFCNIVIGIALAILIYNAVITLTTVD